MKIGKFREVVGTPDNDRLRVRDREVAYASAGSDRLEAAADPLLGTKGAFALVGGFGHDTYVAAKRGVTIVMDYGNTEDFDGTVEDTLIAKGIGISKQTSFVLEVDNRHLLAGDTKTGQFVLALDWKKPRNQFESIQLSDGVYSHDDIVENYKRFPNYLGNHSWRKIEQEGILDFKRVGVSSKKINKTIQSIIKRTDALQGVTPPDELFSFSSLHDGGSASLH